jgi:hypothetical protein
MSYGIFRLLQAEKIFSFFFAGNLRKYLFPKLKKRQKADRLGKSLRNNFQ